MSRRYSVLFADADNTLFDFTRAEEHSFYAAMRTFQLDVDAPMYAWYSQVNDSLWKAFERGEITQPKLRVERFRRLMEAYALPLDPVQVAAGYTEQLAQSTFLMPGALECMRRWAQRVPVYLVTNGLGDVQRGRLERSALRPYVRDIIISQEVGAQKPDPRMFEVALERAGWPDRGDVLMLGDSLSSDIRGAAQAHIDSCYFNPRGLPNTSGITPTYEIRALHEADALLTL